MLKTLLNIEREILIRGKPRNQPLCQVLSVTRALEARATSVQKRRYMLSALKTCTAAIADACESDLTPPLSEVTSNGHMVLEQ